MNVDYGNWGGHLLFAMMCIVMAIVGIVLARNVVEQWLQQCLLLQGILLACVASAAFFPRQNELKLGGVVIIGLLIIHSILGHSALGSPMIKDDENLEEDQSTS